MQLPPALSKRLRYKIEQLEEEKQMRYVISFERLAKQEGQQQGERQGGAKVILRQLERKYGAETATAYRTRIEQADAETLLA